MMAKWRDDMMGSSTSSPISLSSPRSKRSEALRSEDRPWTRRILKPFISRSMTSMSHKCQQVTMPEHLGLSPKDIVISTKASTNIELAFCPAPQHHHTRGRPYHSIMALRYLIMLHYLKIDHLVMMTTTSQKTKSTNATIMTRPKDNISRCKLMMQMKKERMNKKRSKMNISCKRYQKPNMKSWRECQGTQSIHLFMLWLHHNPKRIY